MFRILGGFAATMALVMVAMRIALQAAASPGSDQLLITDTAPVSAAPAVWPTTAALSSPVDRRAIAAAPVIKPPPDLVGRAKFPSEDPRVVDGLAFVNMVVNRSIQYADDQAHYGVAQLMTSAPSGAKGDCEDYALAKMVALEDAGLPIVQFARLRLAYAPDPKGKVVGHALLEVRLPKGAIAFLDNNFDELKTRAELEARGFQFFDW